MGTTAAATLGNVAQASDEVRAMRDNLDAAIAHRDRAITEALADGVAQTAIAAAAGVSQATVSRIDRDRKAAEVAL